MLDRVYFYHLSSIIYDHLILDDRSWIMDDGSCIFLSSIINNLWSLDSRW